MLTIVEKKFLMSANIKNQAKWFYGILEDFCYNKNTCYPSQKLLAEKAGKSERTIQRYISELKACGAISVKRRAYSKDKDKNETNIYTLSLKNIGLILNNAIKSSKNADTTKKSCKYNKVFIDDISEVASVINSYIEKEGVELITQATDRIKNLLNRGNKITIKGFETYLQKVIYSIKAAIHRQTVFNNKKPYIKKPKASIFNSFEQRPFDETLEGKLLGYIPVEKMERNNDSFMSNFRSQLAAI